MTPVLTSPRLKLTPYVRSLVAPEHIDWLNNKELMQYSEQRHHRHTMQSQYKYVDNFPVDSYFWLIQCGRDDIGTITAIRDVPNHRADMGILMGDPIYQGAGFAAEAWNRVMQFLFENGTHKITCGCRGDNWRMRRLAVTSGMHLEAEIPAHFLTETGTETAVFYGRFANDKHRSEWEGMWSKPFWDVGDDKK